MAEAQENVFDLLESGGESDYVEEVEEPSDEVEVEEDEMDTSNVEGEDSDGIEDDADSEEEENEVAELKRQLDSLRSFISNISIGQGQTGQPQVQSAAGESPQRAYVESDFVGDMDLEDFTKDDLNKVINEAVKKAITQSREEVLLSIPRVVSEYTTKHVTLQNAVKKFYEDNSDLKDHRQAVSYIANNIASANPEWSLKQVFDATAESARQMLGMKTKTSKKANQSKKRKPSQISTGGSGKNKKPASSQDKKTAEIMDLLS